MPEPLVLNATDMFQWEALKMLINVSKNCTKQNFMEEPSWLKEPELILVVLQGLFRKTKRPKKKRLLIVAKQTNLTRQAVAIVLKLLQPPKKKHRLQNPMMEEVNHQKETMTKNEIALVVQVEVDQVIQKTEVIENDAAIKEEEKMKEIRRDNEIETEIVTGGQEAHQEEESLQIYVAVSRLVTDHHQEETMKEMPVVPFRAEQIEIESIEMLEGITYRHHADVPLLEIAGDPRMQTWNCLREDKIDPILVDQEYSPFLKYVSNSSVRKTGKVNAEDGLEKDNYSSLKKNVAEKTKSTGEPRKRDCTEKEMS